VTTPPPFEAIERLAERVLGGAVVFFIGAGFSISSEGNTTDRLIGRLLARLLAMGTCLAGETVDGAPSEGRAVLDALGSVFELPEARRQADEDHQPARCMTAENVKLLAREYYKFNEWCVSALGILSREMKELDAGRRPVVGERIHRLEGFLLAIFKDAVPLEEVRWEYLGRIARDADRGKALFLDTMGFANPDIMAGRPREREIDDVARSYGQRLLLRHHALARLAREGLLPCLVTTNYDLLLEGAYRLAGFQEREALASAEPDPLPTTAVPSYSRIAGATQFFARGENYRTALLLKIHGCAENYRDARTTSMGSDSARPGSAGATAWADYLPALVFTYREIQTWRADAWSRDLLRTLLRTNTLALCGYSGADPVMHSTFREVYEEMADVRPPDDVSRASRDAPLFFFDIAGKREFHGLEILRASTEAIGSVVQGKLTEHPNRVEFQIVKGGFPNLDDQLCWLLHRVLRAQQAQSLRGHLRRVASEVLGHPCPDEDYERLNARFDDLRKAEQARIAGATGARERRRRFDCAVGWTWHFLPGLLRELALGEFIESQQGPGRTVRSARRGWWYFPATERAEWTAWAAVVEMALGEMVRAWRGKEASDDAAWQWISAEGSPYATVSFAKDETQRQPFALSIRLAGFARNNRASRPPGAFRRVTDWELGEKDVPWPKKPVERCPDAHAIWRAALGETGALSGVEFALGASDARA
jgi:hypothetical protein